jgi:hypothetical protein
MENQVRFYEHAFVYTKLRCNLVDYPFLAFGSDLSPIAIEEYYLVRGEKFLPRDVVRN